MSGPTLRSCGERAVLVELEGLDQVLAAADTIRAAVAGREPGYDRVMDVGPAARTVLVGMDGDTGPAELDRLRQVLGRLRLASSAGDTGAKDSDETVEIAVSYDGPDLAEVAEL